MSPMGQSRQIERVPDTSARHPVASTRRQVGIGGHLQTNAAQQKYAQLIRCRGDERHVPQVRERLAEVLEDMQRRGIDARQALSLILGRASLATPHQKILAEGTPGRPCLFTCRDAGA